MHNRIRREKFAREAFSGECEAAELFDEHEDLSKMREPYDRIFLKNYQRAFLNYVEGNWEMAKGYFEEILADNFPNDPLCKNHLKFMQTHDFEAPKDWPGYKYFAD